MNKVVPLITLLLLGPFLVAHVDAMPVQLEFLGTGSGTLAGSTFTDANFVVSFTGDSADIGPVPSPADVLKIDNLTGRLTIAEFTAASFVNVQEVFVNRTNQSVGIRDAGLRADWLALTLSGAGLDAYALDTTFGPITDTSPFIDPGTPGPLNVPLDLGELNLTAVSSLSYSALAVPAPPVMLLFPSGLFGGVAWMRRRKKARQSRAFL